MIPAPTSSCGTSRTRRSSSSAAARSHRPTVLSRILSRAASGRGLAPPLALDLRANLFTGGGVARLLAGLDAAAASLARDAPALARLKRLDLSDCAFAPWDARRVAAAVASGVAVRIRRLGLRNCRLGDAGVAAFAAAYASSSSPDLDSLDLSANGVGPSGAAAIARLLAAHGDAFPASLVLDGNPIGSRGATRLATAIAGSRPAYFLSLNACGVDRAGAAALLVGLVDRSVQVEVSLDGNADVPAAIRQEIRIQLALAKYAARNSPRALRHHMRGRLPLFSPHSTRALEVKAP